MFRNYLKIALRSLLKQRGYTFINVAGLAVGLAAFLLIMLYVQDEFSFDNYHEHSDRLYRVNLFGRLAGNDVSTSNTCPPMAAALLDEYPEVEHVTRLYPAYREILVRPSGAERGFTEKDILFADSTFFQLFSINVIHGDANTALREPNTIVINRSTAIKYFGETDVVGRTLTMDEQYDYRVTAVCEDIPSNTHFTADLLASFITLPHSRRPVWVSNNLHTYILLREGSSAEELEAKFPALVRKYVAPQVEQMMGGSFDDFIANGGDYHYELEAVRDIHLHSRVADNLLPVSDVTSVKIFMLIGFFILLLACINFMNLATARSANRAKEVGIRKVVGSKQSQLVRQFLAEAILLTLLSLGIGLLLVELVMPWFNTLAGKTLATDYLGNLWFIPGILALAILVGLLAGGYPAFYLSAFRPGEVLKGKVRGGMKSSRLRGGLVIFQFAIAIILLVGTLIVGRQLDYVRNKRLGFEKEQVLVVKRANALRGSGNSFEEQLRQSPDIQSVALTWHLPGESVNQNVYEPEATSAPDGYIVSQMTVGYGAIETLGIEMAEGRPFSRDFGADSSAFVINEAAVALFGWENAAIGKRVNEPDPDEGTLSGKVIGVARDFHFSSLHSKIKPAIIRVSEYGRYFVVRLRSEVDMASTLAFVEQTWEQFAPNQPFEYSFLDDDFDKLYRADRRVGELFGTFSALGIFIACLGLLGLASFSTEQRCKEIGVRKVLGAPVWRIVLLLSQEFSRLVVVAFVVAVPVSYYFMQRWLQGFAYRTELEMDVFLMAGLLTLVIATATVSYQSLRAALANPARTLRYE